MVRFYSSIDSDDIVLNSVVTDYLHRTDFDVVPRKLISKMQAFSQRIHVTDASSLHLMQELRTA